MATYRKFTVSKKIKRSAKRRGVDIDRRGSLEKQVADTPKAEIERKDVVIPQVVPVRTLAEVLGKSPIEVVGKLFENGVAASINESVDFDTAAIIADDFGFDAKRETVKKSTPATKQKKSEVAERPPVVTVMGHVDHGKTTLLDAIRSTDVASKESGGITQHIGAYQVEVSAGDENKSKTGKKKSNLRKITFLDTPGHEAFSTMRAQGANVTDIVILVVAADDGVKPQTTEAISHARAAGVPIIVAINKIDAPGANAERVKRELADHNLVPEEWGGNTPMVAVSAKQNQNIDALLELIILTADLMDLKADYHKTATATIIESKIKPGLGPVATVLVSSGTLKQGQSILVNNQIGKIKTMEDASGRRLKEAAPAMPVQISGFKMVPQVGSVAEEIQDEKQVKGRMSRQTVVKSAVSMGLGEISQAIKKGDIKTLNLILKADVRGSLEAIENSLNDIKSDEVGVKFINASVGDVNESDINLAVTSSAIVIAFNVSVPPSIKKLSDSQGVKISRYEVIYNLIDDVKKTLQGLLEPKIVETEVGRLKVMKVFLHKSDEGIVGGLITKGQLRPGLKFRVKRNEEVIANGIIDSLQVGPDAVDYAQKNTECGIRYKGDIRFKPDDIVDAYQQEEIVQTIK